MTTLESDGVEQELWHVEVGPGDVRPVTLEQLDEAFQQGLVTESTRVWQEGMACAVSLGELLGGGDEADQPEPAAYTPTEPVYAAPVEPAYVRPEPAYAAPEVQSYPPPVYPPPVSYSAAQREPSSYVPRQSPPPPSRAPESAWPPVVAATSVAPSRSSVPAPASTPAPPSMAPLAFDVPEYENPYARSRGGKGKFLLAAIVVAGIGGAVAFQMRAQADTVQAAAVQAPPPPAPEPPKSHAYDPGPPVKLGESKPPIELTVRESSKTDDKPSDKKADPKLAMASGRKPKPAVRAHHAAPSSSAGASHFKLGKSGNKYDPLNGSL